jgi:hypothetical protein
MARDFAYTLIMKMKNLSSAITLLPKKKTIVSSKYLASLNQLSTIQLIDLMISKNAKLLVIEGAPSDEQLSTAMADIIMEFSEVSGGDDAANNLKDLIEVTELALKIERGYALLDVLNIALKESLFNQIYSYQYPIGKIFFDKESAKETIKLFESYLKLDGIKVQNKLKELPKENEAFTYTLTYFFKLISAIEQGLKVIIHEETTNAYKFAVYISNYKNYQTHIQKQNQENLK